MRTGSYTNRCTNVRRAKGRAERSGWMAEGTAVARWWLLTREGALNAVAGWLWWLPDHVTLRCWCVRVAALAACWLAAGLAGSPGLTLLLSRGGGRGGKLARRLD
jgi:hypothetical protein